MRCADPALDVTATGVYFEADVMVAYFRVADASAAPQCEPGALEWSRDLVRGFYIFTEDYGSGGGYSVQWIKEGVHREHRVLLYSPQGYAYLPVAEERNGNELRIRVPLSGMMHGFQGDDLPYALDGPVTYHGFTHGYYGEARMPESLWMHLVWIEDEFEGYADAPVV